VLTRAAGRGPACAAGRGPAFAARCITRTALAALT